MNDLCLLVKGPRGRVWYRADSASTFDPEFAWRLHADAVERWGHTGLAFDVGIDSDATIAPLAYRPWAQ